MAGYVVRTPDGGTRALDEGEICREIVAGTIDLDATFAAPGNNVFKPITQHRAFQKAFERRMGLSAAPPGSDDTPKSERTPDSNPTALQTRPGAMVAEHTEPKTPITDGAHSDTLIAMVHPDQSFDTADLALTSQDDPLPSGTFPPADPAPIGHGASPPTTAPPDPTAMRAAAALSAWALVFGVLYVASIVLGGGHAEAEWRPDSAVLWVRIALVGGLGAVLSFAFSRDLPITARVFRLTWQWAAIAILAGAAVGAMAPFVRPHPSVFVAAVLAATVAIAEEIFFRGFIGRVLTATFRQPRSAIAGGALLYGMYYATYYVIWQRPTMIEAALALTMITVGAGLPYALLQDLTKGVTASLLCHVAVNVVGVIVRSF